MGMNLMSKSEVKLDLTPASSVISASSAFSNKESVQSDFTTSVESTPESKSEDASLKPRNKTSSTINNLEESKALFVEALVDSAVLIIETIWSPKSNACIYKPKAPKAMPLRRFIQETLKRSRTSYSTFQVSLYYLILAKPIVEKGNETLRCGRRCFLTALILASKYLQDKNYSISSWSKISGLSVNELRRHELDFLMALDWKLHVQHEVYNRWSSLLLSSATEDGSVWVSKVKSIGPGCFIESVEEQEHEKEQEQEVVAWEFVDLSGSSAGSSSVTSSYTTPLSPDVSDSEEAAHPQHPTVQYHLSTEFESSNKPLRRNSKRLQDCSYLATPILSEQGVKRCLDQVEQEEESIQDNSKRICV